MKKNFVKFVSVISVLAFSAGASAKSSKKTSGVTTVYVGTGNSYAPYCYLDDKGNLTGLEKEILDEVDKLLPQYEFEYQTFTFKDVLVALAAGKIDIGAHQYEVNPERQQSYLYSTVPYTSYTTYITVTQDSGIKDWDDLAGKTVFASIGGNSGNLLEKYNAAHPDKAFKIVYGSPTEEERALSLANHRWDADVMVARDKDKYEREYGVHLKQVGTPLNTSSAYYLFRKGNTKLQQEFDAALRQLKDDGTLSRISVKYLGGDYITK